MYAVTPLHICSLVARWQQRYTRNTCYCRTAALRRTLRAIGAATGHPDLALHVPRVKGPKHREVVATLAELDALHRHADLLTRIWLRITVALALGQNEVHMLSPAHFDAEKRTVTFTRKKTGETQTLPVPDDLAEIFERAPEAADPSVSFLTRYNAGRERTRSASTHHWHLLKRAAGVNLELTPHDLRRTTANAAFELTKDLRVVQQLLGHSNMQSTVSYLAGKQPNELRPLLSQLWKPQTELKQ